jgi:hypothetical protein
MGLDGFLNLIREKNTHFPKTFEIYNSELRHPTKPIQPIHHQGERNLFLASDAQVALRRVTSLCLGRFWMSHVCPKTDMFELPVQQVCHWHANVPLNSERFLGGRNCDIVTAHFT